MSEAVTMRMRTIAVMLAAMILAMIGIVASPTVGSAVKPPTGTGTYNCTNLSSFSGQVTYKPAWSDTGKGKVKATVSISTNSCTGGTPTPSTVTISGSFKFANGGGLCTTPNASTTTTGKLTLTYTPTLKKSKYTVQTFTEELPNGVGTILQGTTAGSYPSPAGSKSTIGYGGTVTGNCSAGISSVSVTEGEMQNM